MIRFAQISRSLQLLPLTLAFLTLALAPGAAQAQTTEGLGGPKPGASETVEATKLSKLPKQKKFVEAEYPAEAAEKGLEAEVVLLLDIDATGQVTGVIVTEPATPPGLGFDEAATLAAQQFEFEPAELDGKPIAIQLGYRTKFKLKPKAPEPAAPAPGGAAAAGRPRAQAGRELHRPAARTRHPPAHGRRGGDDLPRRPCRCPG